MCGWDKFARHPVFYEKKKNVAFRAGANAFIWAAACERGLHAGAS